MGLNINLQIFINLYIKIIYYLDCIHQRVRKHASKKLEVLDMKCKMPKNTLNGALIILSMIIVITRECQLLIDIQQ